MSDVVKVEEPKVVVSHLTHREEAAYRMALRSKEPPLSPQLQSQLFELFLRGATLDQIHRVNSSIRLGAIVRASIEGDWVNRRALYVQGMVEGIRTKVQQNLAEGADFLGDFLSVFHKLYGDKFKRYLQTGNESELGDLRPTSVMQYKMVLELLLKATGLETKTVKGEVRHALEVIPPQVQNAGQPMTGEEAMKALFALHGMDQKEND